AGPPAYREWILPSELAAHAELGIVIPSEARNREFVAGRKKLAARFSYNFPGEATAPLVYSPVIAFHRIRKTSKNIRSPSRKGCSRVPSLCAHRTGTSSTRSPARLARNRISGS